MENIPIKKDKINKNRNVKVNCSCGGKYTKANKSKHLKTKKHSTYLNNAQAVLNVKRKVIVTPTLLTS
jgi:hypothetical protein